MTRLLALALALTACGSVEVRETAEEAAHRTHLAICAAYAPEPVSMNEVTIHTPLWQRLAWALLCPES